MYLTGGRYCKVAKKEIEIHNFFASLYYSVGETLPHGLIVLDETPAEHGKIDRARLIQEIIDIACSTALEQHSRGGPKGLAERYLPPGSLSELYLLFLAFCTRQTVAPASASHFRVVWRKGWCKVLHFRTRSTHSLCKTCHQLKLKMKCAATLEEHVLSSEHGRKKATIAQHQSSCVVVSAWKFYVIEFKFGLL